MNKRIKELLDQACVPIGQRNQVLEKFAELIVQECADICMELAAKCAGLPSEGALAVDCANLIKQDFGVKE